jgi:hypothetical protein
MAKASASLVTARQLIAIFCQRPERTIPSYRFVLFPDVRSNGPDLFGYGHRHPHQFGDISHPHFFEHPGAVHLNCLFVNAKSTPDLLVQPTSDYVAQTVGADGRPCPAVPLSRRRAMSALGQKQTLAPQTVMSGFTPDNARESGFPHKVMSALLPKADMCGATSDVRYGPRADKPE